MNIIPFKNRIWLSSPTMHGDELKYVTEVYETNWMSTVGKNINEVERLLAERVGVRYAVALSAGTASLHLAMKLAGEAMYGQPEIGKGALSGKKVFCSDVTFDATVNPVVYEDGIPVFVDTERDTWNMDPVALEKAWMQRNLWMLHIKEKKPAALAIMAASVSMETRLSRDCPEECS